MFVTLFRIAVVTAALATFSGCAAVVTSVGVFSPSVVQIAAVVDRAKLVGDGVSYAQTRKSLSDHFLSYVADADCRMLNVFKGRTVCEQRLVAAPQAPEAMIVGAVADGARVAEEFQIVADELALLLEEAAAREVSAAAADVLVADAR